VLYGHSERSGVLYGKHIYIVMRKYIQNLFKGWIGEKKASLNIWVSLNANLYHRVHDLIIPSRNGTTQIDHLLVSKYGLFIVETKNRSGWIFGAEDQVKWTQSVFGKKYTFQNPLRQTFRQKKVLSEFLDLGEALIHTVVYFVGDCKFKTPMPPNVLRSGLGRYIKRFKTESLSSDEVRRVLKKLNNHVSENKLTKRDHVKSLRERHNSDTTCPKCGSRLVKRTAKRGKMAGSMFLGCENYPKCRFTKNA